MAKSHPMYVCDNCSYARYHPLTYCPKCPGKLTKRDVPHPADFKTTAEQVEWLTQQGLDYSWEECATAPCMVLVERLNNLKELESFCYRMSTRSSDRKLTPEGHKWHEYAKTVRDARRQLVFIIAKVDIPKSIVDESWSIYKPFRATRKAVRGEEAEG